jgi:hypothetical protein
MNIASEASKLLTNKYFLYFMVFLAVSNVLGYLVTNKVNASHLFRTCRIFSMTNFSKNMSVILLVAIVATNLLMANKTMREGLENASKYTYYEQIKLISKTRLILSKLDSIDPELSEGIKRIKNFCNNRS